MPPMENYDVVIAGATPAGIAAALAAARRGHTVFLSHATHAVGGMLANGLTLWDTFHDGRRSPLHDEVKQLIRDYYRGRYGEGSPQHKASLPGPRLVDHQSGAYEPSVAQRVFESLLSREPRVTFAGRTEPLAAHRMSDRVESVEFEPVDGGPIRRVRAGVFIDATYEGDLLALCGASFRIGREGRGEFAEPHAGGLFAAKEFRTVPGTAEHPYFAASPRDALEGRLNLRTWHMPTTGILPQSTGRADHAVQAYNFRLSLCRDPANRVDITQPRGYLREDYLHLPRNMRVHALGLINDKIGWNGGRPIGWNFDYPAGDRATRRRIMARYRDFALGVLFHLQNDESIEPAARQYNRQWGLSRDEFVDNEHIPYEFYVREGRRLVGRYVLRESDGLPAPNASRPPCHEDAIAFTDWPMDSVQCLPQSVDGPDGKPAPEGAFFLSDESRPAMVPYRSLLPRELCNLLVPVAVSATHVFWGAIRLEPVWLQTGEVAGLAAALALEKRIAPDAVNAAELQSLHVASGGVVAFFNDLDKIPVGPMHWATQVLAARGFFDTFDADVDQPLDDDAARRWTDRWGRISPRARTLSPGLRRGDAALAIAADLLPIPRFS